MTVPAGGEDPFARPEVDVDEWRDAPVPHRYVHGSFAGTDTRFSFYLPPADRYEGRFFQHVTPVPLSEHLAQGATGEADVISMSAASGAYFVETNGGGAAGADPSVGAHRANAAAAVFSRTVAQEVYGPHRPYGYLFGGSGGGYRTIGAAEGTEGVWDGFVPYVIGSPMAIPNMFTVRMHAQRVLRHRLDRVVDAVEPGGSGDPYEGLDPEERDALREVTRMGFPPRAWVGHRDMGMHAFPALYGGVRMADAAYFDDFWEQPGYLGHAAPASLLRDRVQHATALAEPLTWTQASALGLPVGPVPGTVDGGVDEAWRGAAGPEQVPAALRLAAPAPEVFLGAELVVRSGATAGERLTLLSVHGDLVVLGPGDRARAAALRPGDQVVVDNSGFLAAQTYHRHQVPPGDEYPAWDQFRGPDRQPLYPQRPLLLGPLFARFASGSVQSGRFSGKMIVVASLLDREALPWQADWYRRRAQEHHGEALEECFRLWYTDNAMHDDTPSPQPATHVVSYLGVLHQALRDLSAWVERGVAPPASTRYEVREAQVVVAQDADQRGGVQPLVSLTADGGDRVDTVVGAEVRLRAVARTPGGVGSVVSVAWDLDGSGQFAVTEQVAPAARVEVERVHAFAGRGTHFVTVRVTAQRDGDAVTPFARLANLARVRVVVGDPGSDA